MDPMKPFNAIVKGTFAREGAFDAIKSANASTRVALVREPNNQHDKNAVRIDLEKGGFFSSKLVPVGYVAAGKAKQMAPRMDSGGKFEAQIVSTFTGDNQKFARCTVQIAQSA